MRWCEAMPVNDDGGLVDGPDPFPVKSIINEEYGHTHILSVCLFMPAGTSQGIIVGRYLSNFTEKVRVLKAWRPDLTIRIYLDPALEFLSSGLVSCEIYVMADGSVGHSPGMIWRHLAFEKAKCPVTVIDIEDIGNAKSKIFFTEALLATDCKFWRVPIPLDYNHDREVYYKAVAGCYLGGIEPMPIRSLFRGFISRISDGRLGKSALDPRTCERHRIFGSEWPDYGFDEFFLNTTIYHHLIERGCVAVAGSPRHSLFFALDIEFAAATNPSNCLDFIHYRQLVGNAFPSPQGGEPDLSPQQQACSIPQQ